MATWYQAKISFQQQDDKGNTKTVTQIYLFDAVSYTDAEARTFQYFGSELTMFQLIGLTKMKFNEIFFVENEAELWFKCRVQYIVFDEKSQNEKRIPYLFLINAQDIKACYGELVEKLGTIQDYIISDINVTKIIDVIPYEEYVDGNPIASEQLMPLSEIKTEALYEPALPEMETEEVQGVRLDIQQE